MMMTARNPSDAAMPGIASAPLIELYVIKESNRGRSVVRSARMLSGSACVNCPLMTC